MFANGRKSSQEGGGSAQMGSGHRRRSGASRRTVEPRELSVEEQREKARDIVLRQLAMMDRSRAQLAEALERRGIGVDVIEEILGRFEEVGLIDDAHFAEVLTRTRFAEKGASRRAILAELQRKGVSRDLAEHALQQIEPEDELEAAVTLAMKKLRSTSGNPDTLTRRTYAALARKGFDPEQCSQALREAQARLA
ncbi:MAG: regulatory protein RecX [Ancrocorticia sp.]